MRRRALLGVPTQKNNVGVIYYTSTRNTVETPYDKNVFGANLLSNKYSNGVGIMTFDGDVTSIGDEAFYGCEFLMSITIPDSVTSIGNSAFEYCTSLTSITIPDSVTEMGWSAFSGCDSLTSVTIGNGVTSIGDSAFWDCSSLTSITIPDSVTSIGVDAFNSCDSLTSVTIGNGVTSIGEWAFLSCASLTSVYCKPITPPQGSFMMFDDNASDRKIYVPRVSVNAYKTASVWSGYADDIVGYDF